MQATLYFETSVQPDTVPPIGKEIGFQQVETDSQCREELEGKEGSLLCSEVKKKREAEEKERNDYERRQKAKEKIQREKEHYIRKAGLGSVVRQAVLGKGEKI